MEKLYAQALMKIVRSGVSPKDAVRSMHAKLKAEGREALMQRIAKSFTRLAQIDMHRNTQTLSIAEASHESFARTEAKVGSGVAVVVDPSLIGGWRLEGQEQLIDASYKKHLLALYQRITQ